MKNLLIIPIAILASCSSHKIVYKVDACPKWLVNKQLISQAKIMSNNKDYAINLHNPSTDNKLQY